MPRFYKGTNSRNRNPRAKKREKGKKRGFRAKARLVWRITKVLLVLGVIGAVALAFHIRRVDKLIEERFDQPRKWNLPSRIYSDAEYVYPGASIAVGNLVTKLDRLGYRNIGEEIKNPGDYALGKGRLDIFLHDFSYPYETFEGFPVRLLIKGRQVASIVNLATKKGLELVRLEPEEVASILDVNMESRTIVTLDEVPQSLIEAIILIEDERFFAPFRDKFSCHCGSPHCTSDHLPAPRVS